MAAKLNSLFSGDLVGKLAEFSTKLAQDHAVAAAMLDYDHTAIPGNSWVTCGQHDWSVCTHLLATSVYTRLFLLKVLTLRETSSTVYQAEIHLSFLPESVRQQIFSTVCELSGNPPEPSYGKVHVFDSLFRLQQTIDKVALELFRSLPPSQKHEIAQKMWGNAIEDPNWKEEDAANNVPLLLKTMDASLGDLTPELQRILDEWIDQAEPTEQRAEARSKIIDFLKDPRETSLDLDKMRLKSLPSIFDQPPFILRLKLLSLCHNQLISLPEHIGLLRKLTFLNLAGNQTLQSWPDGLLNLPSTCPVGLKDTGLSESTLKKWEALRKLAHIQEVMVIPHRRKLRSGADPFKIFGKTLESRRLSGVEQDLRRILGGTLETSCGIASELEILSAAFEPSPDISRFDLDALLQKYQQTNPPPSRLFAFMDWAGIPNDDRRQEFEDTVHLVLHSAHIGTQRHAIVQKLFSTLAEYFDQHRRQAGIGTPTETTLKNKFIGVYESLINANSSCIDQILSQLQMILLHVVAENAAEANPSQANITRQAALSLCRHRGSLLWDILERQNPGEVHMADLEREVIRQLNYRLGLDLGNIFSAGAAYRESTVVDLHRKVDAAVEAFENEYNPMKYLLTNLRTYHGDLQSLRNEILIWANQNYDLSDEDSEKSTPFNTMDQRLSEDFKAKPASDGGNLTFPAIAMLLHQLGLIRLSIPPHFYPASQSLSSRPSSMQSTAPRVTSEPNSTSVPGLNPPPQIPPPRPVFNLVSALQLSIRSITAWESAFTPRLNSLPQLLPPPQMENFSQLTHNLEARLRAVQAANLLPSPAPSSESPQPSSGPQLAPRVASGLNQPPFRPTPFESPSRNLRGFSQQMGNLATTPQAPRVASGSNQRTHNLAASLQLFLATSEFILSSLRPGDLPNEVWQLNARNLQQQMRNYLDARPQASQAASEFSPSNLNQDLSEASRLRLSNLSQQIDNALAALRAAPAATTSPSPVPNPESPQPSSGPQLAPRVTPELNLSNLELANLPPVFSTFTSGLSSLPNLLPRPAPYIASGPNPPVLQRPPLEVSPRSHSQQVQMPAPVERVPDRVERRANELAERLIARMPPP